MFYCSAARKPTAPTAMNRPHCGRPCINQLKAPAPDPPEKSEKKAQAAVQSIQSMQNAQRICDMRSGIALAEGIAISECRVFSWGWLSAKSIWLRLRGLSAFHGMVRAPLQPLRERGERETASHFGFLCTSGVQQASLDQHCLAKPRGSASALQTNRCRVDGAAG